MQFPIKQIFHEMAAEKLRLCLTIFAVVWATVCITTMLAAGEGLRQGLIRSSESGNGKLIYLTGGYASEAYGNFHKGKPLTLKIEDVDIIRALPSVQKAVPSVVWNERVTYQDRRTWQKPIAVTADYKQVMGFHTMLGSRWFNPMDMREQRKVIVIGHDVAARLFNKSVADDWISSPKLTVDPVGMQVKVGANQFTVIGVLKKNSAYVEQGTPVNESVFVPITTWQRFHLNAAIGAINIVPAKHADRLNVASTAKQVIARKNAGNLQDSELVQATDMLLRQKTMRQFLLGLQGFLGIIGLVTLGVAGIGIANVMYATVKKATRDIGVRMAVGATPTTIKLHYLLQSLLTMAIGGGIGLLLSFLLVKALAAISLEGNMLYDSLGQPVLELSLPILLLVVAVLAFVGVVSAWFPARRAANITPLEALQSE